MAVTLVFMVLMTASTGPETIDWSIFQVEVVLTTTVLIFPKMATTKSTGNIVDEGHNGFHSDNSRNCFLIAVIYLAYTLRCSCSLSFRLHTLVASYVLGFAVMAATRSVRTVGSMTFAVTAVLLHRYLPSSLLSCVFCFLL